MKKIKSKMFSTDRVIEREQQEAICGGNNSDVTYTDTKSGGRYDIGVDSLIDTVNSQRWLDKPTSSEFQQFNPQL